MAGESQQQPSERGRPSTVVVTSENLAAFHAEKLGLEAPKTPEPKKDDAAAAAKPDNGKPAAAAEDGIDDLLEGERKAEKDPGKHRLNRRFSELTGQRNSAVNERDAAKAEALREKEARLAAERQLEELRRGGEKRDTPNEPAPAAADIPKPDRAKFPADAEGDAQFSDAMVDWRVDQRLAARDKKSAEDEQKQAHAKRAEAWNAGITTVRTSITDFDKVINESKAVLSNEATDAIHSMPGDTGPRVLYYFAQYPQEAERIGKLTVGEMYQELGIIRTKVTPAAKKDEPKKDDPKDAAAEISKAPKPAEPLDGTHGGPGPVEDERGNLRPDLSYQDYKRLRKERKIR